VDEYGNRVIKCTNDEGHTTVFTERGFTPFLLMKAEGIYTLKNKLYTEDNSNVDGATYLGQSTQKRSITLQLKGLYDHDTNRDLLYSLFKSDVPGTMTVIDGSHTRKCTYYVEGITSTAKPGPRIYKVNLVCPDPFFYDPYDVQVKMADWVGAFEFPHEFKMEEIGYRLLTRMRNVKNDTGEDGVGISIKIECMGNVVTPTITHVQKREHITVGYEGKPLNMVFGDVLEIITETNNKHVYFTHNGVKEEINHYLTEDSEFFQLGKGNNNIGYSAVNGVSNMIITITYKLRYAGA
jgi:hypothetical protein